MRIAAVILAGLVTVAAGEPLSVSSMWFSHPTDTASAFYGSTVASAGDINGDDCADVLIAAPYIDRVYVYYGTPTGLPDTADLTLEYPGEQSFGSSMASADVNGDGYSDVLIGAPIQSTSLLQEGKAYLFLGGPGGLASTPAWTAVGEQDFASFGVVAGAGDVNGDGYPDALVGSPTYHLSMFSAEGRLYLYLGGPAGLASTAAWSLTGTATYESLGSSHSAGDVNGDGFSDVVIGGMYHTNGTEYEGRVHLLYGGPAGPGASSDWSWESDLTYAYLGTSVAVGDVNGDGYADVLGGAPRYANAIGEVGAVYVWHGSASGPAASPSLIIEGDQAASRFAAALANLGDVNHDGRDDVLIGEPDWDEVPQNIGRIHLHVGSASGLVTPAAWTTWGGWSGSGFGGSIAGAGDVNNDGGADVVAGDPGSDWQATDEGSAMVYYAVPAAGADTTPPTVGTVADGAGSDVDVQASATTLSANWTGFADAQSGIAGYEWAIGTTAGSTDVLRFTDVGTATSATATVTLTDGTTYYVTVRATNGAGSRARATSDGVLVQVPVTPPASGGGSGGGGCTAGATPASPILLLVLLALVAFRLIA